MKEHLGETPAPKFTSGALAAVPAVVGLWPVLLTGVYAINKRKVKIAEQEKREAVSAAVEKARKEAADKLAAAMDKAEKDKNSAIEREVAKALKEAAEAQEKENS
jgi:biopolymer transport protein ExbB/TolQ